ncbi:MAG: hypothetical protein Q9209_006496 [Squamulea sp. 1 TL-2023]
MAVSTKNLYQKDQRWIWKLVLRVIAIILALVGVSCVAFVTDYLREWVHRGQEGEDRDIHNGMLILPWLLFTLCLSVLWNTANILILFFHSRPLTPSANLACDSLLLLSLSASGIWLCLAATTNIDGNSALDIHFNSSSSDFFGTSTKREIPEIIGICTTFLTALLHTPLTISAILTIHHLPHSPHHPISTKDIEHLAIHPALRPSPSPLPYPNPNHPTCAYAATPSPMAQYPPPRAVRYKHQASAGGLHVRGDMYFDKEERYGKFAGKVGVLEDKGGLLREEKAVGF